MSIPGFAEWIKTPLGRFLLSWEQREVDASVADCFGFFALQIGRTQVDYLRNSRIGSRLRCGCAEAIDLYCDFEALPIAEQSVDLVMLPHVLEFSVSPHQVLREIERILVPDGQLVLTVFNPASLWGLRRALARKTAAFPWQGHFLTAGRLKDWLQLLGFEVQSCTFGAYRPPFSQATWIRRSRFLERMGARWWPIAGGVYVVQATKRVPGMRLVTPAWKLRLAQAKRLAPVVQSQSQKQNRTDW
ncbi:class I SAM-dependent methyltransferase [Niveibacterium terrae]|uniref:class I SAM-dependent methyltransferase n=1 Tax=Niveibacterium terrae TaxID=3373598 RepID=UPI003A900559